MQPTFVVVGVAVAPMTNVGCVPPSSDEIGTTGSDHGVMIHPPKHTAVLLFVNKDFLNSTLKVLRIIWALLEEDRDGVN